MPTYKAMVDKRYIEETVVFNRSDLIPDKIEDRFDIVKVLGQGTAGTVYHAIDRARSGKVVALKVLADIFAFDDHTLQRFHDEIKICCSIHHKNIVQAYEMVQFKDSVGYTMELVKGFDLGQMLHHEKFSFAEIDSIMYQLLDAISELHDIKVMHRDIKLENIILAQDGILKLSDLGLVKKLESKGLTKPGLLLGTPQYMPPEYIKSAKFDERSDVYACGIVLYELLSGKRRMADKMGVAAIQHLLATKFAIPRLDLPPEYRRYQKILNIALAIEPEARFQSAKEMRSAFDPQLTRKQKDMVLSRGKTSLLSKFKALFRK